VKVSMTKPKQLHTSHVSVKLKLSQDLVMWDTVSWNQATAKTSQ
jgi:hypothetical protein